MNEQFDKDLKDHISKVFENFEDPGADAGWQLLREKFPEKEKDRGIAWLWFGSAAAILLILLGIGTWVNLSKQDNTKIANKRVKSLIETKNIAQSKLRIKSHTDSAVQNSAVKAAAARNLTAVNTSAPKQSGLLLAHHQNNKQTQGTGSIRPTYNAVTKNATDTTNQQLTSNNVIEKNNANHGKTIGIMSGQSDTAKKSIIATNHNTKVPAAIGDKDDKLKFTQPAKKAIDSKIAFGVYAATYFNYAKGSSNQLNVGAGLTAEIALTKNLKLSSGIAIAQNTLSYDNQPGVMASQTFISTTNRMATYTALNSNAISSSIGTSVNFKNYNAQLIGLDVPVNLKYDINPEKSTGYVLLGLSSGTFISQSYTYQYGYGAGSNISQTQSQTNTNSFSGFYFARMLNVSFGVAYPLGKNSLVVEPFLKYPLQGMGEQQIKFGAGGINLKFDLKDSKK